MTTDVPAPADAIVTVYEPDVALVNVHRPPMAGTVTIMFAEMVPVKRICIARIWAEVRVTFELVSETAVVLPKAASKMSSLALSGTSQAEEL